MGTLYLSGIDDTQDDTEAGVPEALGKPTAAAPAASAPDEGSRSPAPAQGRPLPQLGAPTRDELPAPTPPTPPTPPAPPVAPQAPPQAPAPPQAAAAPSVPTPRAQAPAPAAGRGPADVPAELLRSSAARRAGLPNVPGEGEAANLRQLHERHVAPLRAKYGDKLHITSGFRSDDVNALVPGSSDTSQHRHGEAFDFQVDGMTSSEVADAVIESGRPFDQLIWYDDGRGGHVHLSYDPDGDGRREVKHAPAGSKRYVLDDDRTQRARKPKAADLAPLDAAPWDLRALTEFRGPALEKALPAPPDGTRPVLAIKAQFPVLPQEEGAGGDTPVTFDFDIGAWAPVVPAKELKLRALGDTAVRARNAHAAAVARASQAVGPGQAAPPEELSTAAPEAAELVRAHAASLGMTPAQFVTQARAYGVDPLVAVQRALRRKLSADQVARLGNLEADTPLTGVSDKFKGEPVDVRDDDIGEVGIMGTMEDDPIHAQGEEAGKLVALQVLKKYELDQDPLVQHAPVWSQQANGFDYMARLLSEKFREEMGEDATDQDVYMEAVRYITALKVQGLWSAPIMLPVSIDPDDPSWSEAFSPSIEVVGLNRDGQIIARQESAAAYVFNVADVIQAGLVEAIEDTPVELLTALPPLALARAAVRGDADDFFAGYERLSESFRRGAGKRRNFVEAASAWAPAQAGPGVRAAWGAAGFIAAVGVPDLMGGAVGVAKVPVRLFKALRTARITPKLANNLDAIADLRASAEASWRAGRTDDALTQWDQAARAEAELRRQVGTRTPTGKVSPTPKGVQEAAGDQQSGDPLIKIVDAVDAQIASNVAGEVPGLTDVGLAVLVPGPLGARKGTLHAGTRKHLSKVVSRGGRESIDAPVSSLYNTHQALAELNEAKRLLRADPAAYARGVAENIAGAAIDKLSSKIDKAIVGFGKSAEAEALADALKADIAGGVMQPQNWAQSAIQRMRGTAALNTPELAAARTAFIEAVGGVDSLLTELKVANQGYRVGVNRAADVLQSAEEAILAANQTRLAAARAAADGLREVAGIKGVSDAQSAAAAAGRIATDAVTGKLRKVAVSDVVAEGEDAFRRAARERLAAAGLNPDDVGFDAAARAERIQFTGYAAELRATYIKETGVPAAEAEAALTPLVLAAQVLARREGVTLDMKLRTMVADIRKQDFAATAAAWQRGDDVLLQGGAPASRQFRAWFGDSVVVGDDGAPKVMYHGTAADFDQFGQRFNWVTPDPEHAAEYANFRGYSAGGGDRIIPVFVKAERPFDADALPGMMTPQSFSAAVLKQVPDVAKVDKDAYFAARNRLIAARAARGGSEAAPRNAYWLAPAYHFGEDGADAVQDLLRAAGFDSIKLTEAGNETFAVLDSRQLKSATGNRGTYSPDDPRILFQDEQSAAAANSAANFKRWTEGFPVVSITDDIPEGPVVLETYHGSRHARGIRHIDLSKSDDKRSFFSARSGELAANYAQDDLGLITRAAADAAPPGPPQALLDAAEAKARARWAPFTFDDNVEWVEEVTASGERLFTPKGVKLFPGYPRAFYFSERADGAQLVGGPHRTLPAQGAPTPEAAKAAFAKQQNDRIDSMVRHSLEEAKLSYTGDRGVLPVYVKLRNPLIVDAGGRKWDDLRIPADLGDISDINQYEKTRVALADIDKRDAALRRQGSAAIAEYTSLRKRVGMETADASPAAQRWRAVLDEQRAARAARSQLLDKLDRLEGAHKAARIGNTRDVAQRAAAAGHDGVIIRNVVDRNDFKDKPDDVVISFSAAEVKAQDNFGTWDRANLDIYYQGADTPEAVAAAEGRVSIPLLRSRLGMSYTDARRAIQDMRDRGILTFDDAGNAVVNPQAAAAAAGPPPSAAASRPGGVPDVPGVADSVVDDIVSGKVQPSLAALRGDVGMSTKEAIEALVALEQAGVVARKPNHTFELAAGYARPAAQAPPTPAPARPGGAQQPTAAAVAQAQLNNALQALASARKAGAPQGLIDQLQQQVRATMRAAQTPPRAAPAAPRVAAPPQGPPQAPPPPSPPPGPPGGAAGAAPPTPKGAAQFLSDGRAIIYLFENADESTFIHETGHILRRFLPDEDLKVVRDWLSTNGINVGVGRGGFTGTPREVIAAEEAFAESFERYLRVGVAPSKGMRRHFETIKRMLVKVYATLAATVGFRISPEMKAVYDRLFLHDHPRVKLAREFGAVRPSEDAKAFRHEAPRTLAREASRVLRREISPDAVRAQLDARGSVLFSQPVYGKTEWTARDISALQLQQDASTRWEGSPSAALLHTESPAKGVSERRATERFLQSTEGPGVARFALRNLSKLVIGGDADRSLRTLSPEARQHILAGERSVQEGLANAVRFVGEGNEGKAVEFLSGRLATFRQGRRAAASGWDATGSVMQIVDRAFGALPPDDQLAIRHFIAWADANYGSSVQDMERALEAYASAVGGGERRRRALENALALFTEGGGSAGEAPVAARFINDAMMAMGASTGVRTVKENLFAVQLLRIASSGASSDDMTRAALDLAELKFGKQARPRLILVMAAHGHAERAYREWVNMGLGVDAPVARAYLSYVNGETVPPHLRGAVADLVDRFGLHAQLTQATSLAGSAFIPKAARDRMVKAMERALGERGHQLEMDWKLRSMQSWTDWKKRLLRYWKIRAVRGRFLVKPRYITMNYIDHMNMMGSVTGFTPALSSATRLAVQSVAALPGVNLVVDALAAAGRTGPGAAVGLDRVKHAEQLRDALQAGGDAAATAVMRLLRVKKWDVSVNQVLNGGDDVVTVAGKPYTAADLRRVAVEEGIFSSFDTSMMQKAIKDSLNGTPGVFGRMMDSLDNFTQQVADTAEAWSERERLGAMISLMELGLPPRRAAQLTVDALLDYANTMSEFDNTLLWGVLFPFWAFQKNAERMLIDGIMSPRMVWRMNRYRRGAQHGPDALRYVLFGNNAQPYGVDEHQLDAETSDFYWGMRNLLENGYGPRESWSAEDLEWVRQTFGDWDELDSEIQQRLQDGYGDPEDVPDPIRRALWAMISGKTHGEYVYNGQAFTLTADMIALQRQHPKMLTLHPYTGPGADQHKAARPSWRRNAPTFTFAPEMTEHMREFTTTSGYSQAEMFLPESYQYSAMKHASGMAAIGLYIAGYLAHHTNETFNPFTDEKVPEGEGARSSAIYSTEAARNIIAHLIRDSITDPSRAPLLGAAADLVGMGRARPTKLSKQLVDLVNIAAGDELIKPVRPAVTMHGKVIRPAQYAVVGAPAQLSFWLMTPLQEANRLLLSAESSRTAEVMREDPDSRTNRLKGEAARIVSGYFGLSVNDTQLEQTPAWEEPRFTGGERLMPHK